MLSSVLALLTCAVIPVNQPLDVTPQMVPASPAVEVGGYVTASSFSCRNFSSTNYVLVFGRSGASVTVSVALPANGSVAYSIPPGDLQGMFVEAIAVRSTSNLSSSGSIALALPANTSDESLWFVPAPMSLVTWRQVGCDVELVQPSGSLVSITSTGVDPEDSSSSAVQVPVLVPRGSGAPPAIPQLPPPM